MFKDHLMDGLCLELEIFQFEVDEEGKLSDISVTWPFPLSVVENVTDEGHKKRGTTNASIRED